MKLICTKNTANKKTIYKYLTPGKVYEGSDYSKTQVMIRDDNGEVSLYPKKNFQTPEEFRDEKISDLLKNF
jgi:hypothetical protein